MTEEKVKEEIDPQSVCCGNIGDQKETVDDMHTGHLHGSVPEDSEGKRLLATLVLNFFIPVAQVIGGMLANSMALISDAVHNFSDFTAVLISYIAFRIGRKGATISNTFGYRRAEILAALINVFLLTGASGIILYHAFHRFLNPQTVNGLTVIILAGVGVIGNGLSALLLHRDAAHSLNVRGAFLHMLGDLFTSVAVLINGILLLFYPWYWLDPLLSIFIAVFILKNGWGLFKESTLVLMNGTPVHLRLEQVRNFLSDFPGVLGVHYLHAWQISSMSTAFSCHVVVPDQPVSDTEALAGRIRNELLHRFQIDHPVLQFETENCGKGTLLCEMACNGIAGHLSEPIHSDDSGIDVRKMRLQSYIFHPLRIFLGAVFLFACYDKILHPQAFAQAVYNYQILPDVTVNLSALILPWMELLLGVCLITGFWLPGAILMSVGLLTIFIGTLMFNQIRGLDIYCGCFSTETTGSPAGLWTVIRDLFFFLVAIYLMVFEFYLKPLTGVIIDPNKKESDAV
ncbi:MAG: hypothetical protein COX20_02910 [Desulfobacterales bacterium CG23_combo_of_CG06-09_8_20_14_all_52_9]|nr:MAG: hypothetical protein COX20_02910 [Desulfobacterales bacterium CG23_combo_of_CG06-09_8_20_14_all_52_9]